MARTKYCVLCERKVQPRRRIGIGTLIIALLSLGLALLLIPFYKKRCPVCGGIAFGLPPAEEVVPLAEAEPVAEAKLIDEPAIPTGSKHCIECGEEVKSIARICRFCGYEFMSREEAEAIEKRLSDEKTIMVTQALGVTSQRAVELMDWLKSIDQGRRKMLAQEYCKQAGKMLKRNPHKARQYLEEAWILASGDMGWQTQIARDIRSHVPH